jgi:hypothetical protein
MAKKHHESSSTELNTSEPSSGDTPSSDHAGSAAEGAPVETAPVETAPVESPPVEQGKRVRHVPTTPAEIMSAKWVSDAKTAARVITQIQALPVDVRRLVVGAVATISTEA